MIASFAKTDQVRFLGHLDLMRALQRALRRSGLPIRYSQGFNPHVLLSLASPLSVGMAGSEELFEVAMETDLSAADFLLKLRPAMPESLPLLSARAVPDQHEKLMAALRTASYEAFLPVCTASEAMASAIPFMLSETEIQAIRVTKSGEKPCDIRPMLHELAAEPADGMIRLTFRAALTERDTLKPDLLLRTLAARAGVSSPDAVIRRLRLYGEADRLPVPLMEC